MIKHKKFYKSFIPLPQDNSSERKERCMKNISFSAATDHCFNYRSKLKKIHNGKGECLQCHRLQKEFNKEILAKRFLNSGQKFTGLTGSHGKKKKT